MNDSIKLKPCPFCGNKPKTKVESKEHTIITIQIQCLKCFTELRDYVAEPCDFETMQKAINKVISTWNTRTDSAE